MDKQLFEILEELNAKLTKYVQDYKHWQIDSALSEAFEDKKKWEPESGESGDATAFKEEYYGDARKCGW